MPSFGPLNVRLGLLRYRWTKAPTIPERLKALSLTQTDLDVDVSVWSSRVNIQLSSLCKLVYLLDKGTCYRLQFVKQWS